MKKIFLIALLLNLASMGQLHAQLFGGQLKSSTSPYPGGTVHCDPQSRTAVVTVTTLTGRIWMDRNLGAQQVATNRQDPLSYGDLYQWGRVADGHQCRNSSTQTIQSTSDQPGHGNFITRSTSSSTSDCRNPHNGTLWQGVNGVNNPCPLGFRIPTEAEFNLEKGLWNQNDPFAGFNSVLKIPFMGFRETDGVIFSLRNLDYNFKLYGQVPSPIINLKHFKSAMMVSMVMPMWKFIPERMAIRCAVSRIKERKFVS